MTVPKSTHRHAPRRRTLTRSTFPEPERYRTSSREQQSVIRLAGRVVQRDRQMPDGKQITCTVRPLDNDERIGIDDVAPSYLLQIFLPFDPIQIDVKHCRAGRRVLVDERVGRTCHRLSDTVPATDRLREGRLACSKFAGERVDKLRMRIGAKPLAPFNQLRLAHDEM